VSGQTLGFAALLFLAVASDCLAEAKHCVVRRAAPAAAEPCVPPTKAERWFWTGTRVIAQQTEQCRTDDGRLEWYTKVYWGATSMGWLPSDYLAHDYLGRPLFPMRPCS